jgi:hypothetical protein
VYDSTPAVWVVKSRANTARDSFAGAALDGKVYIWGGIANGSLIGSTEMYDRVTDKWTTQAQMARTRRFSKGAAIAGELHAIGGIVPPGRKQVPFVDETIHTQTAGAQSQYAGDP